MIQHSTVRPAFIRRIRQIRGFLYLGYTLSFRVMLASSRCIASATDCFAL
jgi:hypothetical protein